MKITKMLAIAGLVATCILAAPMHTCRADDGSMTGNYQAALALYQQALAATTDPAARAALEQGMAEVQQTINNLNTPGSPVIDSSSTPDDSTPDGQQGNTQNSQTQQQPDQPVGNGDACDSCVSSGM